MVTLGSSSRPQNKNIAQEFTKREEKKFDRFEKCNKGAKKESFFKPNSTYLDDTEA